ncbi:MAG: nitrous oxide reductase family maturation protein NosD, partial [Haloarcula sp.]
MSLLSHDFERTFAVVTAVLFVLSVVSAGVVSADATRSNDLTLDPDIPDTESFSAPTGDGTATVDGETYDSAQAAIDAADPGDTVMLDGRFNETVVVTTPDVTLAGSGPGSALLHGDGEGDVLAIESQGVTVADLWVRNSGYSTADNDAAIFVNASQVTIRDSRVTDMTFGIWLDGVDDVDIRNNTIAGREEITQLTERGNGIQIWKTEDSVIRNNDITAVRDGL